MAIDPRNPGWSIGQAIVERLTLLFSTDEALEQFGEYAPESIMFVPPGTEAVRPTAGGRVWATVALQSDLALTWETGGSYVVHPVYKVRVNYEDPKRRENLPEKLLEVAHFIRKALGPSTLDGQVRRNPKESNATTYATKAGAATTVTAEITFEYEWQGALDITEVPVLSLGMALGEMKKEWALSTPARTNPVMTSNTAPAGVASASGIFNSSYPAWQAFNGAIATGAGGDWVAPTSVFPSWVQYQFATAVVIRTYRITTRDQANVVVAPKAWTLSGSNDGVAWDVLDSQSGVTVWANARNTTREYYMPDNATAYTHYRLTVIESNQNNAGVGELELCTDLPAVARASATMFIENTGASVLRVESVTVPDWLEASGVPESIAAGATASVTLTVIEDTPGAYSGDIIVVASDGTRTFPVTATVV